MTKKKVSPKLVFNEEKRKDKKKKKRNCYLYVTKDNASQIACLVFGENDLKKGKKKKGL